MYQMRPEPVIGDIVFWVSSGGEAKYPNFAKLFCDLVFVVKEKIYWKDSNSINQSDLVVDSSEAFSDHYVWGNVVHRYKHRRRFTLKADKKKSFQPQTYDHELIDIVPYLAKLGIDIATLRKGLCCNHIVSAPMRINLVAAESIREALSKDAAILLRGTELQAIRSAYAHSLTSQPPSRWQGTEDTTKKKVARRDRL